MAILALILVNLFSSLYERLCQLFGKRKSLAAFFSSLVVILFFLLPILAILIISAKQALDFFRSAEVFLMKGDESIKRLVETINRVDDKIPFIDFEFKIETLQELIFTYKGIVISFFSGKILGLLANLGSMLANGFIFFLVLIYLFPERSNLLKKIRKLSPLPDRVDILFLERLSQMASSMIKGTVIVALIQGILGGISLLLVGIKAWVFWALIMTLFSFIPIGAGIIWGPTGIFLLASGRIWQGIFVLLWGAVVINSVDNILRPRLVGKETKMHPVLIFLSILGGLRLFGLFGFLYGPLIMVLLLTALEVYQEYYSKV